MKKLLLIDGNSIMNRAFYGIMGNKMLTTDDGKYTNALYGFLAILFKNIEEVKPDYILVAFDSKTAADVRKKVYDGYKKSRHKMPEELAQQMPEIKEILKMNIPICPLFYMKSAILPVTASALTVICPENLELLIMQKKSCVQRSLLLLRHKC